MQDTDNSTVHTDMFYVQAGRYRLRVRQIEPASLAPDRPSLVFLHEALGNIALWGDYPKVLCQATGCRGLVYERRGYGESDMFTTPWPEDYLITESAVCLPEFLAACDISEAILVGHSDGGTIALMTASLAPRRVRAVITEAAHIFNEPATRQGIREAMKAFEHGDLKARLARYHGPHTETIVYRWADRWLSPEFREWNIEHLLPDITCPLLVLQGEKDEYATPAQVEGIARQVSGPVETQIIPDCRHIPHFQARKVVVSQMKKFIDRLV